MRHRCARRSTRTRLGVLIAGISAPGPGSVACGGGPGAQSPGAHRSSRGDPVTGATAAALAATGRATAAAGDPVEIGHVLAGEAVGRIGAALGPPVGSAVRTPG